MPLGTKAVIEADMGGAQAGKTTKLARGISSCGSDGVCVHVADATITYHLEGEVYVGEIAFTSKGQSKKVPFRALSCPVPESERMVCG